MVLPGHVSYPLYHNPDTSLEPSDIHCYAPIKNMLSITRPTKLNVHDDPNLEIGY